MPDESAPHFPDFAGALALLFVAGLLGNVVAGGVHIGLDALGIEEPMALSAGFVNVLPFGLAAWAGYRLAVPCTPSSRCGPSRGASYRASPRCSWA